MNLLKQANSRVRCYCRFWLLMSTLTWLFLLSSLICWGSEVEKWAGCPCDALLQESLQLDWILMGEMLFSSFVFKLRMLWWENWYDLLNFCRLLLTMQILKQSNQSRISDVNLFRFITVNISNAKLLWSLFFFHMSIYVSISVHCKGLYDLDYAHNTTGNNGMQENTSSAATEFWEWVKKKNPPVGSNWCPKI